MSVFSDLLKDVKDVDMMNSRAWYYTQSRKLTDINPRDILRATSSRENLRTFVRPGLLYMFLYTPKNSAQLPYYDRFPLVFPFDVTEKGFTGLNMHYLPPVYRAVLMDSLSNFVIPNENENLTRIKLSYELLTSMSRLRYYKPAVKQYLNNYTRSKFLLIPSSEWNIAMMLPLERFAKKNIRTVFQDSRNIVRKR